MKEPTPDPADAVDDLVASYLHHEESRTDAAALLERIEADGRLDSTHYVEHNAAPLSTFLQRAAWWTTIVGMVFVAFLGGRYFDPASANASTLLRNVKTVHTQSVDRCYRVQHAPDRESGDGVTTPSGAWESLLWTRGDRFWSGCAIGKTRLTIGRDAAGTVWLSPSRQKGIRFSPEKTDFPKDVETICQINSMTVPILVDDVLADFDLQTDGPSTQADGNRSVVWARLKPGRTHAFLSAATLEIDAETDVLVRLVLWLHKKDQGPNGTVTYTLINQPAPGDDSYQLESHLDAGAVIEDHSFQLKK
jgi:hypothetical protein